MHLNYDILDALWSFQSFIVDLFYIFVILLNIYSCMDVVCAGAAHCERLVGGVVSATTRAR
jgi:hypothetical protein